MDECVITVLSKIKKQTSWRHDKDLRDSLDNICSALKDERKRLKKRGLEWKDNDADKYWGLLKQALDNKAPGVKAATLEAIQVLIQSGYMHGDAQPLKQKAEEYYMMEEICENICNQFECEDENVKLYICLSLLEVVKMGTVNGDYLMRAIETCHQIFVTSQLSSSTEAAETCMTGIMEFMMSSMDFVDKTKDAQTIDSSNIPMSPVPQPDDEDGEGGEGVKLHGFNSQCIYACVEQSLGFHYDGGATGWETEEVQVVREEEKDEQKLDSLPSLRHRDIYLSFRKLCSIACEKNNEDPNELGKIFALTALRAGVDHMGEDFNKYNAYVYLVRKYLLQNLLQNFISNSMDVVDLSLHIFTPIVNKFRVFIKKEIEVFIVNIFLVILNSVNSAMKHKEMVIAAFNEINKDPNFMIELFINYDCDINSRSVYEDVVKTLTRLVEGRYKVQVRKVVEGENGEEETITVDEEEVLPTEQIGEVLLPVKRIAIEALEHILAPLADKTHITEQENNNTNTNQSLEEGEGDGVTSPSVTSPVVAQSDTEVKLKAATDIMQKFDEKRKYQEDMVVAFAKFNKKPKDGIAFLIQTDRIQETPESVAQFLYKFSDNLDKREIGDYMGDPKDFNQDVLKAYTRLIDFTGLDFDEGVRKFLERFRLPGEAQKIDRMMEQFATSYCSQNPGKFENTDAAFVLGYSVIMLNTDLHNPNIAPENRMTREGFCRNCRGVNDGADFDPDFLISIYDRIESNPISLKEDDMARQQQQKKKYRNQEERKQKAFAVEKMDIANKLKVDIDDVATHEYFEATGKEYILPMFKILFPEAIGVFTKVLEISSDEAGIKSTLVCIKACFEISCSLNMDIERDRAMEILGSNTLSDEMEFLDIANKQVETIRVMLELAQSYGNHLGSAWKYILKIVSSLSQVHLYGLEQLARFRIEETGDNRKARNGDPILVLQAREKQQVIESIINLQALDRIFARSVNLDSKMIVEFVSALCSVSLDTLKAQLPKDESDENAEGTQEQENEEEEEEEGGSIRRDESRPPVYLMQKVVEVADANMYCRSRLEWSQIWQVMSEYYISLGCFPMGAVALAAIDSLKQLSIKFLDKEDLRAYNFQKAFIRPFEYVISRTPSNETRELILHVVHNIVQTRANSLSSGWKIVFAVCAFCAENEQDVCTPIAWSMAKELLDNYLTNMVPEMYDLITTYCSFIAVENVEICKEAREYVSRCGNLIIEGQIVSTKETEDMFTDQDEHTKVWWPFFMGLSRYVYTDVRYEVRNDCLVRLFAVLQDTRLRFTEKLWVLVFDGFVFPLFDEPLKTGEEDINQLLAQPTSNDRPIRLGNKKEQSKQYLQTTGALALYTVTHFFVKNYERLRFLMASVFKLVLEIMNQRIESFARISVFCLKQMFLDGGEEFNEQSWREMLKLLEDAFVHSMPDELVLEARKALHLIFDKKLRSGGTAPKVGKWVRTPIGVGKLLSVDSISAVVELLLGNAYFHQLNELEDLEKLRKMSRKVVTKVPKKTKKEAPKETPGKRGRTKVVEEEDEDEDEEMEEVIEEVEEVGEEIKLEKTDSRTYTIDEQLSSTKSLVQSDLACLVYELFDALYKKLSFEQIKQILGMLQSVSNMTRDFHNDRELRTLLKTIGYPKKAEDLPLTLIYQQVSVETTIVHALFMLYMDTENADRQTYANDDLMVRMESLLTEYVDYEKVGNDETSEKAMAAEKLRCAHASVPLITELLRGFLNVSQERFLEFIPKFYPMFVTMVQYSAKEVRLKLADIFNTKIQKMLFPNAAPTPAPTPAPAPAPVSEPAPEPAPAPEVDEPQPVAE